MHSGLWSGNGEPGHLKRDGAGRAGSRCVYAAQAPGGEEGCLDFMYLCMLVNAVLVLISVHIVPVRVERGK